MKQRKAWVAAAGLALISLTVSYSFAQAHQVIAKPDVLTPAAERKDAPDFTLSDQNDQSLTLSAYKGNVVLLDF